MLPLYGFNIKAVLEGMLIFTLSTITMVFLERQGVKGQDRA
jgi:hypothetical protein